MLRSLALGFALTIAPLALQAQAATTCADGTTSTATGRGACSGHGGVKKASAKATKTAAKAENKTAKADVKADTKASTKAETKVAAKTAKADAKTSASATDANGATAKCKDGTYSHAASRRGACSRHGGVAEWLKS
jgi:hypothetical protein